MARPHHQRGFTLIEVMVVVAIVGILGALAVYSVRKYILAAKTSEAVEIIQQVKAAQENYKDETFTYLDVSENLDTLYPMDIGDLGDKKFQWGSGEAAGKWRILGVQPGAPVQFGYACVAGNGGALPTTVATLAQLNYPANPSGPWYVVRALADRDGNGVYAEVIGSNFTDEIYVGDDTE